MEGKPPSNFWKLFLALAFWTLILSAVQGLGLYYSLTRSTAVSKLDIA